VIHVLSDTFFLKLATEIGIFNITSRFPSPEAGFKALLLGTEPSLYGASIALGLPNWL